MPDAAERIAELQREVAANPASRQFYQLGELLRREGRAEEAVAVLRAGLVHHPRYVAAWVSLGRALIEVAEAAAAAKVLQRAIELDSQNPVAWRLLGEARLMQGNRLGALPASVDPMARLKGWRTLAAAVDALGGVALPPGSCGEVAAAGPLPEGEGSAASAGPAEEPGAMAGGETPPEAPTAAPAEAPVAMEGAPVSAEAKVGAALETPAPAEAPFEVPWEGAATGELAEPFVLEAPPLLGDDVFGARAHAVPSPEVVAQEAAWPPPPAAVEVGGEAAAPPAGEAAEPFGEAMSFAAPLEEEAPRAVLGEEVAGPPEVVPELPTPPPAGEAVVAAASVVGEAAARVEEAAASGGTAEAVAPPPVVEPPAATVEAAPMVEAPAAPPGPPAVAAARAGEIPPLRRPTVTLARLFIQQQDYAGAVAVLEQVLDQQPMNQEARDLLELVRDMMEPPGGETLPPLSLKERKVAALQRWLASLTLGRERWAP